MLRKLLAAFLSLLLLASLSVGIIGIASSQLLKADTYLEPFAQHDVYADILSDTEGVSVIATPPEMIDEGVRGILAYIRGERKNVEMVVTLQEPDITPFAEQAAQLPECTGDVTYQGDMPTCRPAGMTAEQFARAQLAQQGLINVSVDVIEELGVKEDLQSARETVSFARSAVIMSFLLAFICSLLLVYVLRKRMRSAFQWIEADMVVVGGSLMASAYLLARQFSVPEGMGSLGLALADIVLGLLKQVMTYGVIAAAIGLVLLAFTSIVHIHHEDTYDMEKK